MNNARGYLNPILFSKNDKIMKRTHHTCNGDKRRINTKLRSDDGKGFASIHLGNFIASYELSFVGTEVELAEWRKQYKKFLSKKSWTIKKIREEFNRRKALPSEQEEEAQEDPVLHDE